MKVLIDSTVIYKSYGKEKTAHPGLVDLPESVAKDLLSRNKAEKFEKADVSDAEVESDTGDTIPFVVEEE